MHLKRKLHPKHPHHSRRKDPRFPQDLGSENDRQTVRWAFVSRGRQLEKGSL